MIMNTVSQACSKLFTMFMDKIKKNAQTSHVSESQPAASNPVLQCQIRQQAYVTDQREQDNKADIMCIIGVNYDDQEDLKDQKIDVARKADVTLLRDDIIDCFCLGGTDAPCDKRPIVAKIRTRAKKVAIMLESYRVYIEEGLTRFRSKLYHRVRIDQKSKGLKTWTQEGKVFTKIND